MSDELKAEAAKSAVALVEDGQMVGLGTGSTVYFAIEELGKRIKAEALDIKCIPTSLDTRILAMEKGIPLTSFEETQTLDIAIDGADQVDPGLNLIKGGGAAHVREKLVASAAERFVVIVDESKVVESLTWPVPTEVLPFSWKLSAERMKDLHGEARLRTAKGKSGPLITDNGNFVLDVDFGPIRNPEKLEAEINAVPGVVENGIFCGLTSEVHVAGREGIRVLRQDNF
jgi:ribose 5-phosphate isomerase A